MTSREFAAFALRWPGEQALPRPRRGPVMAPDVGLLISDLDRWARIRSASLLLSRVATRWLVLTSAPPGPLWGAVIEAGAAAVVPSDTGLDEVGEMVRQVARGERAISATSQEQLLRQWNRLREERRELGERMHTLTPREREVLRLLYAGESVLEIAGLFEVSPATVRSQVKAVLRKLDVSSQLGAVAALGYLLELDPSDQRVFS
ncbi:helix-turn-helix transcriptional regulator [Nocardioides sp.]|uniref:helix-turn-helix transcriptional regulator n=1 Tax=Nocardioides sp. TaxID=35761 RepID=UPI0039E279BA